MGTIVGAGVRYMAIVIGTGVLFGMVRVPFVVPRLGERWAELAEMPFMAVAIFLLLVPVWGGLKSMLREREARAHLEGEKSK